MKSKKNLTRFTYKNAAFQGWRLCLSRYGVTFVRYFPDRRFGGERKSLAAAEKALAKIRHLLDGIEKGDDGKLPGMVVTQVERILNQAVPKEEPGQDIPAPLNVDGRTSQRAHRNRAVGSVERIKTPA
jgi:hypothetical protein